MDLDIRVREAATRMWELRLKQLLEFRAAHGHIDVPRGWTDNPSLAHWVVNQRREIRQGRMIPERRRRLEEQGIRWSCAEELLQNQNREWERMFEALSTFHRQEGHGNVPSSWSSNPELGRWVARQRHLYRSGSLREDRRCRLEGLRVGWPEEPGRSGSRDLDWERMVAVLSAFRELHQHSNVPKGWPENPMLARWVARQRHLDRIGGLRPDRRVRLEELGALREPESARRAVALLLADRTPASGRRDRAWIRMLEALTAFKSVQGHCSVPRRWTWNQALARWVSEQRRLRRKGSLNPDRVRQLELLGFEWIGTRPLSAAHASTWDSFYRRLLDYRSRHGDCNVPARFSEDPALGRWIAAQRTLRRSGVLKRDRLRRLDAIGFSWTNRRTLRIH